MPKTKEHAICVGQLIAPHGLGDAGRAFGAPGDLDAAHPPSDPLVEGTSSFIRGSTAIAARSARASPLKQDSDIW